MKMVDYSDGSAGGECVLGWVNDWLVVVNGWSVISE